MQRHCPECRSGNHAACSGPPCLCRHVHASYLLRNVEPDLWRRVKSKAALQRISMKALIEQLLRDWLDG